MKTLIHWRSLQARLLLGALAWISAGTLFSGIAISGLFREHVTSQFVHELNDHLTELGNLYAPDAPGGVLRPVSDPRFSLEGSGYYWQIERPGRPLLRSPSLEGRTLRPAPTRDTPLRGAVTGSDERLILIRRTVEDPPGRASVSMTAAGDEAELDGTIRAFNRQLAVSLTFVAAGLVAAALAQVTVGLQPLRRLQRALAHVRAGDAEDLPVDFPSEVQPLVTELNAVIRHNRDVTQRARAQAGNLGHALRTHLAILTAQGERLAAAGGSEAAAGVLAECQAMSRHVDYHVARARAAASRGVIGATARPGPIADEILSALGRLHAGRGLILRNDASAALAVRCDRDDLYEMLANLADNAAKWARSQVRISAESSQGQVWLIVEDDGPGLPDDAAASAFQRGVRLDEQTPGSGLGLAIVRDLAELYGGVVDIDRGDLGGARAILKLPADIPSPTA